MRILLVDDHQIMCTALALLLRQHADMEVVGHAFDAIRAWEAVERVKPELVVIDLDLSGGVSGMDLIGRIRATYPGIKVVVLTGHVAPILVNNALRAGANAYVAKADAPDELVHALRAVAAGHVYLCPEASGMVVDQLLNDDESVQRRRKLSPRETEVLRRIADGQSTKEIAFALSVSAKTVETHRQNLMDKLSVSGVAGLTKYAIKEGLTKP